MISPLDKLSEAERRKLREVENGRQFVEPMLATLTHDTFSSDDWIYERKLDGERVLAVSQNERVRLFTRNTIDVSSTYPEIVDGLSETSGDFAVDGEIVAFDGGTTSFARLQKRMHDNSPSEKKIREVSVFYYLFDIMRLDAFELCRLPLRTRKSMLKKLITFAGPIRFVSHRNGDGEAWLKEACAKGWEGLIAKRAASSYVSKRSRDWLKFKCDKSQEFVIVGYSDASGSRIGFGSLLLGYYDAEELRYAGRVGTGFDDKFLESFRKKLEAIEQDTSPLTDPPRSGNAHWVTPKFVGEVAFTEWTDNGKLRHPRFLGIRRDKAAKEVVREAAERS